VSKVVEDRLDPFTRSYNSRLYDINTTPVLPVHSVRQITLTSDANGHGAVVIKPTWLDSYYDGPTITAANDMTAIGASVSGSFYSATAYAEYRIVSVGVRVRSIASPTTASGIVRIYCDNNVTSTGYDLTRPQDHYESLSTPLYQCNVVAVSEPTGIESLETLKIDTAGVDARGWTSITVSVDGVPATTAVLELEIVHNFEAIPAPEGGFVHHAQKPAPHLPMIEHHVAKAREALGGSTFDNNVPGKSFHDNLKSVAKDTFMSAGAVLATKASQALMEAAPDMAAFALGLL